MPEANPVGLAQQMYFLQNPQQGLQLQQQQALAQQMMQEGSQQPDPNAEVSGHVVRTNPFGALARVGERLAGVYEQKDANQKLGQMMQGGAQGLSGAATGVDGINPRAPLTGDFATDYSISQLNPEGYKAQVEAKLANTKRTDLDKNVANPATAPYMAKDQLVNVNGHMMPASQLMGDTGASAPGAPQAAPSASSKAMRPENAAKMNDLYGDAPALPVNLSAPQAPTNIDFNNPIAVANAKAEGEKTAENVADTEKTFNVVSSQLPRALERFQILRGAAKNASFGGGVDDEGTGFKQEFHNQADKTLGRPESGANATIQQISSQGILPEIGPVIASTGGRGNQFMEKMAAGASGIHMALPPDDKLKIINGVEDQYIGNMKAQAAVLRANGRQAPSDQQIDAAVQQYKAKFNAPASGVTHQYIPGQGIVPVGGNAGQ